MTHVHTADGTREKILVAAYSDEARAQQAVERLFAKGFPMDMMSVLGRIHAAGDDVLGIYHMKAGERIRAWAKQGALWGGIGGLLTGAAGLFVMPGIGPVLAAGPIVEALVAGLEGVAVGGAAMAGAAAATHLASAMHRIGITEEEIVHLHRMIEEGSYLLLLRTATGEAQKWKPILGWSDASEVLELPYTGIMDLV